MDIDWTKIRAAVARIEKDLAKVEKVIDETDVRKEWPEVTRAELQAACPNWREEFGDDWSRGFLQHRIGKGNYLTCPGGGRYHISPRVLEELRIGPGKRQPRAQEAED